jgi:phosphate-selective porin
MTDTVWTRTEARTTVWTLGADYFLNANTKISLNYDIKQEDLAFRPYKNNILSAQLQVKF